MSAASGDVAGGGAVEAVAGPGAGPALVPLAHDVSSVTMSDGLAGDSVGRLRSANSRPCRNSRLARARTALDAGGFELLAEANPNVA